MQRIHWLFLVSILEQIPLLKKDFSRHELVYLTIMFINVLKNNVLYK
ncbi:hypothetical protein LCGC14_2565530, partial [marine sediment metagenome]